VPVLEKVAFDFVNDCYLKMTFIHVLSLAAATFVGSALALTGQSAAEFGYPSGVDVW
jgi:hypothetical protein